MFFVLKNKNSGNVYVSGEHESVKTSDDLNRAKLFSIVISPGYDLLESSGPTNGTIDVKSADKLPSGLDGKCWECVPVDLRLI